MHTIIPLNFEGIVQAKLYRFLNHDPLLQNYKIKIDGLGVIIIYSDDGINELYRGKTFCDISRENFKYFEISRVKMKDYCYYTKNFVFRELHSRYIFDIYKIIT